MDPIVNRDGTYIFISSGYNTGGALYSFNGKKLEQLWFNQNLCCHFTTPIFLEGEKNGTGTLYGVNGNTGKGKYVVVDFRTGETLLQTPLRFGNLMMADDKFIYNTERGELVILEPSKKEYIELASVRVINDDGKVWNHPVVCNGYVYSRSSSGKLVCLKIK